VSSVSKSDVEINSDPVGTEWHFLVGVLAGAKAQFYLDGLLVGKQTLDGEIESSTKWSIGRGLWDNTYRYANGIVANVYLYNRALSPLEVWQLYQGKTILDGLVLWLMPQREFKGTWWDRSGYMNHGTIYNATPSDEKFLLPPLR